MFFVPVLFYDTLMITGFPHNNKPDVNGEAVEAVKVEAAKPSDYRIRMGKWEEVYDAVDGTKTWYNTETKKTTQRDPFW